MNNSYSIETIANEFNITVDNLETLFHIDPKTASFYKKYVIDGYVGSDHINMFRRVVKEVFAKNHVESTVTDNTNESDNTESETTESNVNDDAVSEVAVTTDDSNNIDSQANVDDENADNNIDKEDKPKRGTNARKKKKEVIVDSIIENVPPVVLRKFLMDNSNIKPEKLCLMDDEDVELAIDDKYAVIDGGDNYLFIKKTTNIIAISK